MNLLPYAGLLNNDLFNNYRYLILSIIAIAMDIILNIDLFIKLS